MSRELVGQPHHQQAAAEQADGDRGRQDHRDRHGDVATKPGQDLVDQEAEAHLAIHSVDAALLVANQPAQLEFDDALAHRVDDVVVVGGHHAPSFRCG